MKRLKLAIVDDDDSERLVLKGFAMDCGYEVVAEGVDGHEAVDICRGKAPDLLIMDVKMPGKDGLVAAAEITQSFSTPVVLLTASSDEETIKNAAEAGVMGYLVKPIRGEELAPVVELAIFRSLEFKLLKKENLELKDALAARKVIERAKGVLMAREGISEGEAFSRIRKISMDKRKSMSEIADVIIMAFGDDGRAQAGRP